jgi:ribonuclease BN (tRNA processing enzyme)
VNAAKVRDGSAMSVRVTFLGAGDTFNAAGRRHAGYLVESSSACVLLDCGPTTLLALQQNHIPAARIDAILLSHLHGDHFAGIPFLFLEWIYEAPRRHPLQICGPAGTEERIRTLFATMYANLAAKPLPFEVGHTVLEPGARTTIDAVSVEPFRVPHQKNAISLGLRVVIDDRTILYSGDTGWTEDLVVQSQGTDLFICECCFFETRVEHHLDYPRLVENRHRFGCRRMILTHAGREVLGRRDEIEIELADDDLVIEI